MVGVVLPFPLVGPSEVMVMMVVVHPVPGGADYSTNVYEPFAAAAAAAVGDDGTHQRDMLPHEHYNQTNS